jgi:hypothetical protein
MSRHLVLLVALLAAPAGALGASACGDAILGVRPLACDGSACLDASDGDGGDSCPEVEEPACDEGLPIAEHEDGCIVGYVCGGVCASLGGDCTSRLDCPGGRWSTSARSDCSEAASLGCCRDCPPISAPPPGFCDGGVVTEVLEGDCVVDFECT